MQAVTNAGITLKTLTGEVNNINHLMSIAHLKGHHLLVASMHSVLEAFEWDARKMYKAKEMSDFDQSQNCD